VNDRSLAAGAGLLALMFACGQASQTHRDELAYTRALELSAGEPAGAWRLCQTVVDPRLRADCQLAAVESWCADKGTSTEALLERCAGLHPQRVAWECAFQVGERRRTPQGCAQAGDYGDDCRLHLLSAAFPTWVPRDARPDDGALLERLAAEAQAVGLAPDDPRAWSAWFRLVLAQQPTLDRHACRALDAAQAEACWQTGRALYEDRLNMARDRGLAPCTGTEIPRLLSVHDDPELDRMLQRRLAEDLCPDGSP
jgi:hypothetical protein